MRVTFDSNVYRRVVDPSLFSKDVSLKAISMIHTGVMRGHLVGYLSSSVGTLEGIQKSDRPRFFASQRLRIDFDEKPQPDGSIRVTMQLGPRDEEFPALNATFQRWLELATSAGFRFLATPRIGQSGPQIVRTNMVDLDELEDDYLERFSEVSRSIESRGVGKSIAEGVGLTISNRLGNTLVHWAQDLDKASDRHEEAKIEKAIAEWADADAIAAHIASNADFFCTEDHGKSSANPSVLDDANRNWLSNTYGVKFVTVDELAQKMIMS